MENTKSILRIFDNPEFGKVTGKGQQYFINKFLKGMKEA